MRTDRAGRVSVSVFDIGRHRDAHATHDPRRRRYDLRPRSRFSVRIAQGPSHASAGRRQGVESASTNSLRSSHPRRSAKSARADRGVAPGRTLRPLSAVSNAVR
jgi:hypothetical protein